MHDPDFLRLLPFRLTGLVDQRQYPDKITISDCKKSVAQTGYCRFPPFIAKREEDPFEMLGKPDRIGICLPALKVVALSTDIHFTAIKRASQFRDPLCIPYRGMRIPYLPAVAI